MPITHIKPNILFSQLKCSNYEKLVTVRLPSRRNPLEGDHSILALETMCLLTLQKLIKPKIIFEFGTCLGGTTLNLALNKELCSTIYTIDLPAKESLKHLGWAPDSPNTEARLLGDKEYRGIVANGNVVEIEADSREYDFSHLYNNCDFIWIDGGHDYDVVESDTENALKMIRPGGVIAWHDYEDPLYPDVKAYLDEFPLQLTHVLGSSLVYKIW